MVSCWWLVIEIVWERVQFFNTKKTKGGEYKSLKGFVLFIKICNEFNSRMTKIIMIQIRPVMHIRS
jgi:hypothetical protein